MTQKKNQKDNYIVELRQVSKLYGNAGGTFTALAGIDLGIKKGELLALVGKSGSGKSTLLNILTGIDSPTSGEVVVAGTPIHSLQQNHLARWRGRNAGIVFQFFQLLPTLTVVENVMLPMDFCNTYPARDRQKRALGLLEQVGVATHAYKLPSALSGGEQQRAAIARAMANDPPIIVADEPTGNLDSHTADTVVQMFNDLAAAGKTVIMATHERDLSRVARKTVTLLDGRIVETLEEHND